MSIPSETLPTHKQLRNVVADRLRSAIVEGEYRPGEWLRQERLAQELGVSQMPVREALKELAAEGLVEHVPYRGVRVVAFTPEDVADLYAHRSFLEGMAARVAAQNITQEEIQALIGLKDQMNQNLAPEHLPVYRELNRQFHQLVYSASRRDYLTRTLSQMWAIFPSMLWGNFIGTASRTSPERDALDTLEHEEIICALEKHDADAAERLVRQHIESAGKQLLLAIRATR